MTGGVRLHSWLLVACALGCAQSHPPAADDGGPRLIASAPPDAGSDAGDCSVVAHDAGRVDPARSEILQLPIGEGLLDQCSRPTIAAPVDDFWTPSEAQVTTLEHALADAFAAPCFRHFFIVLDEYHAQYVGIRSEGRDLVYASFVHESAWTPTTETPTPPYVLCDGGELAWGIVYDVATETFEQMAINGSIS